MSNNIGLHNCDQTLWDNYAPHTKGFSVHIVDGHAYFDRQFLARFRDNNHAAEVMKAAKINYILKDTTP